MNLDAGRVIAKIEMHAHLVPETGETGEQLAERAKLAGYNIMKIEEDGRVLIAYSVDEAGVDNGS